MCPLGKQAFALFFSFFLSINIGFSLVNRCGNNNVATLSHVVSRLFITSLQGQPILFKIGVSWSIGEARYQTKLH